MTLFDIFPPSVAGSPTSEAAAVAVMSKTEWGRRELLRLFREAGERGLTDLEIESLTGWSGSFVRPRRGELADGKYTADVPQIQKSGRTRLSPRGRDAVVWILTAAGQQ